MTRHVQKGLSRVVTSERNYILEGDDPLREQLLNILTNKYFAAENFATIPNLIPKVVRIRSDGHITVPPQLSSTAKSMFFFAFGFYSVVL